MRLNVLGLVCHPFRTLFKSRNIIIISEQAVNHYPVSAKIQLAGIVSVLFVVCWVSYSTGSYMAAKNVIREKDKAIVNTSMENKKIEHDFSLLKRDLLKMSSDKDGELSEYSKFVLTQYEKQPEAKSTGFTLSFDDAEDGDKLIDRVEFLEKQVENLELANRKIISDVRERTVGVVDNYEEIIGMTGLDVDMMKRHASATVDTARGDSLDAIVGEGGRGGPFIPSGPTNLVEEHQAMVAELDYMNALANVLDSVPTALPIKGYKMMSGFGKRIDPFTHRWARHEGLDMAASYGAKIYATASGKISHAGRKNAYGNMVEIKHPFGITTRYGHLSKILVTNGQEVKEGDVIGIQGSTGRSTGDHLHYEVRLNDRPMNPSNFLKAGLHVSSTK